MFNIFFNTLNKIKLWNYVQFEKYPNENWTQIKILSCTHEKVAIIEQNFMTKA